jgi:hypothetical protein
MSDSTAPQNPKTVEAADPFERELQKKIRNRVKKLEKISEIEKKVKAKEIEPNQD